MILHLLRNDDEVKQAILDLAKEAMTPSAGAASW